jgi:peptide/nickel transport system permease protein
VLWLGELAQGNLGQSIFLQQPVAQALLERAEPTLFLALFAVAIAALDRRSRRHVRGRVARQHR